MKVAKKVEQNLCPFCKTLLQCMYLVSKEVARPIHWVHLQVWTATGA